MFKSDSKHNCIRNEKEYYLFMGAPMGTKTRINMRMGLFHMWQECTICSILHNDGSTVVPGYCPWLSYPDHTEA